MKTQTFKAAYATETGLWMLVAQDYVVIVRACDGLCRRFTYEQLGLDAPEGADKLRRPRVLA